MIQFTDVCIEEFMSVHSAHTHLNNRGLLLIQGENKDATAFESNGASKSTIFTEAIVWALYGETIRGYKGDEVVNRFTGKNTKVSVTLTDDDTGDTYRVIRHRKHKDFKNSVILLRNDKNITAKSDTDVNKFIVELLQMDFSSFINSIMFGQGISKMFASATDSEQKKILERMLQIDIFKACQERAKEKLAAEEKTQNSLKVSIQNSRETAETMRQQVADLQVKEEQLEGQINSRISELTLEKEGYLTEQKNLGGIDNLLEDKESLLSLIKKCKDKIEAYKEDDDLFIELSASLTASEKAEIALGRKIRDKKKELEDIISGVNVPTSCPTCGQEWPKTDTSKIQEHLRAEIDTMTKEADEESVQTEQLRTLLMKMKNKLVGKDKLKAEVEQLQDTVNSIVSDISKHQANTSRLTSLIASVDKQVKEQESRRGTTYTDVIERTIQKVNEIEDSIKSDTDLLTASEELGKKYDFWVKAYGNQGIKSKLLDSVTPFLNQRANYYLQKLADGTIEVEFNTQTPLKSGEVRDKFCVNITNANGSSSYTGSSGGEKRRIDVAVNMALQDLVLSRSNKRIDFIAYDEVYDGLDNVGCEAVIELLKEKAAVCGTILVVSHNEHLKDLFPDTIKVIKEKGKVTIQEA